jgi:hypothetical protein
MAKGFVYILSNAGMPGLLKIGFSTKVPTERAAELNTTGVPSPFDVEYYCLIEEPAALEAGVHEALAANRHTADREFFRLSLTAAIQAIEQRAPVREHTWCKSPSTRPRPPKVSCHVCGAGYVTAQYCPKCRVKLTW